MYQGMRGMAQNMVKIPVEFDNMRQQHMGQTYQPSTKSINGGNFVNARTSDTTDSVKKQPNNYVNTRN